MERMKALQTPKIKPRLTLQGGEWLPKPLETKPVEVDEHWETCGAPKVGKPCPKCKGSTDIVLHDDRVKTCHWCTDGAKHRASPMEKALISVKDKRNFDRRVMKGLAMCFIMTTA